MVVDKCVIISFEEGRGDRINVFKVFFVVILFLGLRNCYFGIIFFFVVFFFIVVVSIKELFKIWVRCLFGLVFLLYVKRKN